MNKYGKMGKIIKKMVFQDNLKIFTYDDIRLRRANSKNIEVIESPFSTEEDYEEFIKSIFGYYDIAKPIRKMLDKENGIYMILTHKELCSTGSHMVALRKLK